MEKQIALISKSDNRVKNVLIVDSFDDLDSFKTEELDAIAVDKSQPHLHGLWDGKKFTEPSQDYLIEIGLLTLPAEPTEEEIARKALREATIAKLGLTEEEAKALFG